MISLCEYKNIAGEPGTGVHAPRIFGFAAVDSIMTVLFALFINKLLPNGNFNSGVALVVLLFASSIIIHKIFCVETTLTNMVYS